MDLGGRWSDHDWIIPPQFPKIGEVLGSLGESLPDPSAKKGRRVGLESRGYWDAGPDFVLSHLPPLTGCQGDGGGVRPTLER